MEGSNGNKKLIEFRVSTVRGKFGEAITMRLLDQDKGDVSLDKLGFSEKVYEQYRKLLSGSEGMLLVTGPTGSGKTTTLYATINSLMDPSRKIMTAEDPIEYTYRNTAVQQTEVLRAKGIDFSSLMRSFLRQDPDIIKVGEIRDEETARMSIKAVQTGHMLLSTLHTQDATRSIGRIKELNIDPATFLSYTSGIMGQRLVRKVCNHCKDTYSPAPEMVQRYFGFRKEPTTFYKGKGCAECDFTGYRGRLSVNELWTIKDSELTKLSDYNSAFGVRYNAIKNGLATFYVDGMKKLRDGETTLEELFRTIPNIEQDREIYKELRLNRKIK